jgi:dTDP-4-amino-4,6-dideoxygalactose transaminase
LPPPRLYLSPPHIGGHELNYVAKALADGWVAPVGPHLAAFETELAAALSTPGLATPHVVALNSGTAAIHLALQLLNVGAGDEVVCPTFTFAATANPILYQGATPVFVDSEAETWNLDPVLLREALLDRQRRGKRVRAIIVVHLYGMPARLVELLAVAAEFGVPVIEDAAEALGSTLHGQPLGTWAPLGVLSFNGNKIITTSGGGALITKQAADADRALYLATQARDRTVAHYQHAEVGYNYRLSNVLAGIGRGQLETLADRVKGRRALFRKYAEHFCTLDWLSCGPAEPLGFYANRWLTTVLLTPEAAAERPPEHVRQHLEAFNVEARPLWKPLHLQPAFAGAPVYGGNLAEALFERGLCLPSGNAMSASDLERVIDAIRRF